ncbi:hypothetical protein OG474_07355 [Kribbella sp. NBC_01505]|uniref:hypothetical protein n=1 Tax=Kribbella sp. NBC_01505 TaxID=2903580 RepID=UPI00386FD76A
MDVNEGYVRWYAPLAVTCIVLSFQPILPAERYGSIWEMTGRGGSGSPAAIGAVLMAGLIALLAHASFRPPTRLRVPAGIAVLSGLIAVMLITRPGVGKPRPELTSFGDAALAVAICTCVLAFFHLRRLMRPRGRARTMGV